MGVAERYWVANLRRDELLDVIQRKGIQHIDSVPDPSSIRPSTGKIVAIWRSESQSERSLLPQVIVGDAQSLEDLWAWAFSYLRGLGPLTSQVRVLTPAEYQSALKRERGHRRWRFAGGLVGMVLGEAIIQTGLQPNDDVGLVASRSTLSFVLARASALGMGVGELDDLAESWERLRQQAGQTTTAISGKEVAAVAGVLASIINDRSSIGSRVSDWLRTLLEHRGVEEVLQDLGGTAVGVKGKNFDRIMKITAEERVLFFDEALPALIEYAPFDKNEKSFVIALMAFLSRPGLQNQIALLRPTLRVFPEAHLWLGAMQAMYPSEETLAYGEGLGWRLSRDIFEWEDVFSTPRHDISIGELQVLLRSRSLQRTIRFLPKTRLDVELAPTVSTWIRGFSSDRAIDDAQLPIDTRQSERDAAVLGAKRLKDAERSLEAALSIVRHIQLSDDAPTRGRRRGRS